MLNKGLCSKGKKYWKQNLNKFITISVEKMTWFCVTLNYISLSMWLVSHWVRIRKWLRVHILLQNTHKPVISSLVSSSLYHINHKVKRAGSSIQASWSTVTTTPWPKFFNLRRARVGKYVGLEGTMSLSQSHIIPSPMNFIMTYLIIIQTSACMLSREAHLSMR
jgi:hypothetical protein